MSEFYDEQIRMMLLEKVEKAQIDLPVGKDLTVEQRTAIRTMAQLDGVPPMQYGYNYNGSKHNARVRAAGNVYFYGCQKDKVKDTCTLCADFLVALCEINSGIIDVNE